MLLGINMEFSLTDAIELYATTDKKYIGSYSTPVFENRLVFDTFTKFVNNLSRPRVFCIPKSIIMYRGTPYVECSDFYDKSGQKLEKAVSYYISECFEEIMNILKETDLDIHIFSIHSRYVGSGHFRTVYEWTITYAIKERGE